MNNHLSMSAEFERRKNLQAATYTAVIAAALLLLFMLYTLSLPREEVIQPEQVIEVDFNLGNGDEGFGTDQPQLPGDPAPAQQVAYNPPTPTPANDESVRDVSTDETSNEAPPVIKPAVSKPDATKINSEAKTVRTNTPSNQPVATPAPPRPRAVLGRTVGGNGNGGNGADTYRPGTNEGVAGGNGDQGRVGGDPNGRDYSGSPRRLNLRVISMPSMTYEDDFNENGNIVLDVLVDANGRLQSASYQISGSTLAKSSKQYQIALRRAAEYPWPKMDGGFRQKVSFNFKVK